MNILIDITRLISLKSSQISMFHINRSWLVRWMWKEILTLKKTLFVKCKLKQCNHKDEDFLVTANEQILKPDFKKIKNIVF